MNERIQNTAALLGRALLSYIFIVSGWGKVTGFAGTAGYIASKGMPLPELMTAGAIAVELLGGLALLVGFKPRWAAGAIFLFLIPTTLIFHPPGVAAEAISFMKNLAIMGGMAMVVAFGGGRYSVRN